MTLFYAEVTFRGVRIVADRAFDFDAEPDSVPLRGYIDFVPSRYGNYDKTEGAIKVIDVVTAGLDNEGVMRDGQGNDSITLVSPISPDLKYQDWYWEAHFRLEDGVELGPFIFVIAPGQRKNLANEALLMDTSTIALEATTNANGELMISGETVFVGDNGVYTASSPIIDTNLDGTFSITA